VWRPTGEGGAVGPLMGGGDVCMRERFILNENGYKIYILVGTSFG
jgi:hypothetical protein